MYLHNLDRYPHRTQYTLQQILSVSLSKLPKALLSFFRGKIDFLFHAPKQGNFSSQLTMWCVHKKYSRLRYSLSFQISICTMRKKIPKTLDQLIFGKYTLNVPKFTKHLVEVHKFTKYLVNSYHQKDVKHYVLTN